MQQPIDWLLEGPPWVQYRTRCDLLNQPEDDPQVLAARGEMIAHPKIQELVSELAEWPGTVLKRHNDATHPIHKLALIADMGLRAGDPGVDLIIERILNLQAPEGPFQIVFNINPRYGGTGEDQLGWMLCDAPLLLYSLLKFGIQEKDQRIQGAFHYLTGLTRENGWPCAVSPNFGKFRGPGRKSDPCPYANLVMLKALSQLPESYADGILRSGTETLLSLWEQRKERRPYLFAMGTGFTRLKAPLIWYDILHVLDVLTQFPWGRSDKRVKEMVEIIRTKADEHGRFTPESVWKAWKGWDFGQKREPSRWISLVAHRMIKRITE